MTKAHARLSASKSDRWINCPGSVTAPVPEGFDPDASNASPWAQEGTAAHALVEHAYGRNASAFSFIGLKFEGVEVTPEMAEAAELYLNVLRVRLTEDFGHPHEVLVEERVEFRGMGEPEPMFGTPDYVGLHLAQEEDSHEEDLVIVDLKYGRGVVVEADAWQFRYYAAALLFGRYRTRPIRAVHVYVVQPRADHPSGPVRYMRYTAAEVTEFAEQIVRAAWVTKQENPPLVPGEWCRFCPSSPICPAQLAKAEEVVGNLFSVGILPDATALSPAEVGAILNNAPMIEAWFKRMREHAANELREGREVPGMKLVASRAQRRWADPEIASTVLSDLGNERYDIKLKSPAQIEKLLKEKKQKLDPQLTTKYKGVTLTVASDKREAITVESDAMEVFTDTEE
jgi:hypothetical protein